MRCNPVAYGALALVLVVGCDSKESAQTDADGKAVAKAAVGADSSAKAEVKAEAKGDAKADADVAAAAAVQPRIGGTIVVVGEYNVEILAFVGGRIEAVIMDAKGELLANTDLELAAKLAAKGDAKADVELKWEPTLARFVGQVDAKVELVPGPIEVSVDVGGKASVGALAELGLAAEASHGGQVLVAGDYSIELVADGGFVHAYAFDVNGKAHAAGDLDLDLAVDGATDLRLQWDAPSASYKAKIDGKLDFDAKPIVLKVAASGKVAVAAVQSFHASAKLAMKGKADVHADVRPPEVKAKADAGAKAGASAKAGGKVETKKSASASAKAGAKASGGIDIGGSAKGGIKIGG